AGAGRFGAMREWVSAAVMLLALLPIGNDIPVPISLPGRAPVDGLAPGGTPCGVTGVDGWANTGAAARPASTVREKVRERMGFSYLNHRAANGLSPCHAAIVANDVVA